MATVPDTDRRGRSRACLTLVIGVVMVFVLLVGVWLASCAPELRELERVDREGLFGERIHWSRDEVEAALDVAALARTLGVEPRTIVRVDCALDDPVYNDTTATCRVLGRGAPAPELGVVVIEVTDGDTGDDPAFEYWLPLDAAGTEACRLIDAAAAVVTGSVAPGTPAFEAQLVVLTSAVPELLRRSGTQGADRIADLLVGTDWASLDASERELMIASGSQDWCDDHRPR